MSDFQSFNQSLPSWLAKAIERHGLDADLLAEDYDGADVESLGLVRCEHLMRQVGEKLEEEATFDGYNPPTDSCRRARDKMLDWSKAWARGERGYMLTGPTGIGKTHLAVAAARDIATRGFSVEFIWIPGYLDALRRDIGEHTQSESPTALARRCDMVIIDEFGLAQNPSDWQRTRVYELIDALDRNKVTALITSNLTPSELGSADQYGERTMSRVADMTDRLAMEGPDYRVARAIKRRNEDNL